MRSKKLTALVVALTMCAGVGYGQKVLARGYNSIADDGQIEYTYMDESIISSPVDISIANEEKVIEMLKKEGKIPKDASYEKAREIYMNYMKTASQSNKKIPLSKMEKNLKGKQNQKVQKYLFDKSTPDTNPKKVNVLVLLVDYKDYKHNSIQPGESDMYYKDYTKEHYENMIFGEKGYKGPGGENLISMKQYYEQQSGGSLIIQGKIAGWYTAPNTAKYYGEEVGSSHDTRPRNLVAHTLQLAAKDPNINLADFDKEDRYDLDGDGNYDEPDGIIDHLMIIHAGVGQEAGGGSLGSDAIWSHRWNLGGLYKIPGTDFMAYDYTIEPEDGAAGVFAHEFGHDLGLPDEYDTDYTSASGEPISNWSIMSSGSWAGKIPGTEPTGFSPFARQFFQGVYGGNWQKSVIVDYNSLTKAGARIDLRQASEEGQVVRISLPDKGNSITKPFSGKYAYWGGKGKDGTPILTSMTTNIDLANYNSATLSFKTWYDIEEGWDFASIQVRSEGNNEWTYLKGNITTSERDPEAIVQVPHGITGTSQGWVDASFDLSAFTGKKIELKFEYATDSYSFGSGLYVDDIKVSSGDKEVFFDNAENTPKFDFNGFKADTGVVYAPHYYLVEWRNHHGVDKGLANVSTLGQLISYEPGMVIWYVDDYYNDNWTGLHPGDGYLGIVDADQNNILWKWNDPTKAPMAASGKYQMRDAAFSKMKESEMLIDLSAEYGRTASDTNRFNEPNFDDSRDYGNAEIPSLGRNIPKLGLKIQITQQSRDNTAASITIKK